MIPDIGSRDHRATDSKAEEGSRKATQEPRRRQQILRGRETPAWSRKIYRPWNTRETNKAKEGMKSSDCLFVSCDNKMQMGNYIQYLKQVLIYLGSSIWSCVGNHCDILTLTSAMAAQNSRNRLSAFSDIMRGNQIADFISKIDHQN